MYAKHIDLLMIYYYLVSKTYLPILTGRSYTITLEQQNRTPVRHTGSQKGNDESRVL